MAEPSKPTLYALPSVQQRPKNAIRLGQDAGNLLHAGLVHTLGLLDLLAVLVDNDGWDLGHVEVGLDSIQQTASYGANSNSLLTLAASCLETSTL